MFCSDSASEDGRYAWTKAHLRLPMALPETADNPVLVADFLFTSLPCANQCLKAGAPFVRAFPIIIYRRGFLGAPPKGSIHTSQKRLSTYLCIPGLTLISSLPLAPLTTMLASSSTLERVRSSRRHGSGAPKRHAQSSPLSHSHTAGAFISPSTDTLLQDPQPRLARPRRKGLSWNIPWRTHRSSTMSSAGLIPPAEEVEKAEGSQPTPLRTP